jgi:hypothetical protein
MARAKRPPLPTSMSPKKRDMSDCSRALACKVACLLGDEGMEIFAAEGVDTFMLIVAFDDLSVNWPGEWSDTELPPGMASLDIDLAHIAGESAIR